MAVTGNWPQAAQRLLDEGLLAEPGMVYRAMRLLADVGALSMENLGTRAGRPRDPMRPGGLGHRPRSRADPGEGAGGPGGDARASRHQHGMHHRPGGVGKTRLAEEIVSGV